MPNSLYQPKTGLNLYSIPPWIVGKLSPFISAMGEILTRTFSFCSCTAVSFCPKTARQLDKARQSAHDFIAGRGLHQIQTSVRTIPLPQTLNFSSSGRFAPRRAESIL